MIWESDWLFDGELKNEVYLEKQFNNLVWSFRIIWNFKLPGFGCDPVHNRLKSDEFGATSFIPWHSNNLDNNFVSACKTLYVICNLWPGFSWIDPSVGLAKAELLNNKTALLEPNVPPDIQFAWLFDDSPGSCVIISSVLST